jgi:hypothetical protein
MTDRNMDLSLDQRLETGEIESESTFIIFVVAKDG